MTLFGFLTGSVSRAFHSHYVCLLRTHNLPHLCHTVAKMTRAALVLWQALLMALLPFPYNRMLTYPGEQLLHKLFWHFLYLPGWSEPLPQRKSGKLILDSKNNILDHSQNEAAFIPQLRCLTTSTGCTMSHVLLLPLLSQSLVCPAGPCGGWLYFVTLELMLLP